MLQVHSDVVAAGRVRRVVRCYSDDPTRLRPHEVVAGLRPASADELRSDINALSMVLVYSNPMIFVRSVPLRS